jgi:hypothetical protein
MPSPVDMPYLREGRGWVFDILAVQQIHAACSWNIRRCSGFIGTA